MPTLSVNLPKRIYKQVESFCKRHNVKRSMLGRRSLVEYMATHKDDPTSKEGEKSSIELTLELTQTRVLALMNTGRCTEAGCEKMAKFGTLSAKGCAIANKGPNKCEVYKRLFGG